MFTGAARRAFASLAFATCHSRACEARDRSGESSRSRDVVFVSRRRRELHRRVASSCARRSRQPSPSEYQFHRPPSRRRWIPRVDASPPKSGARHPRRARLRRRAPEFAGARTRARARAHALVSAGLRARPLARCSRSRRRMTYRDARVTRDDHARGGSVIEPGQRVYDG